MLALILDGVSGLPVFAKVFLAFFSGLVPVLLWLWFWEHEDKNPEPKKLIFLAFGAGMVAVIVALVLESIAVQIVKDISIVLFIWAAIEELIKYGFAYFAVLSHADNDEPIDSVMYMIMIALGFSALENAIFIFKPLYEGYALEALMTGNLRFIGATLLHTITSGIVGLSLAFSFYKPKAVRRTWIIGGLITAIVLHAFFNLSIIRFEGSNNSIIPFYTVWIAVIAILLAFEKVKKITN